MSLTTVSTDSTFEPESADAFASRHRGQRLCIRSQDLLFGQRELLIRHGDQEYRLRLTQNDKLILTK